jgi:hypothetical protein
MTMPEQIDVAIRPNVDDKRKYPRFSVAFPVSFGDGVVVRFGMVVDISREGCRIRCADSAPDEQYFHIQIWHGDPNDMLVVELVVMRWTRPGEFGVEFIRMAPDDQARLRHIIRNCEETQISQEKPPLDQA